MSPVTLIRAAFHLAHSRGVMQRLLTRLSFVSDFISKEGIQQLWRRERRLCFSASVVSFWS